MNVFVLKEMTRVWSKSFSAGLTLMFFLVEAEYYLTTRWSAALCQEKQAQASGKEQNRHFIFLEPEIPKTLFF